MKSNINIASNIHLRTKRLVADDQTFIKKVNGYPALFKLKADVLYGTSLTDKLTTIQLKELNEIPTCSLANNGEITHGKIYKNGVIEWVGRCEYSLCSSFATCTAAMHAVQAQRNLDTSSQQNTRTETEFVFLGIPILQGKAVNELLATPSIEDEQITESNEDTTTASVEKEAPIADKFKQIDESTPIIQAAIDTKILVNAGPGTGKTYSAINRLLYILQNDLVLPDKILVLCYSRTAVNNIKSRIAQAVYKGDLPFEANKVGVFTFNWFASRYLIEIEEDIAALNHNERIELFNTKINPEFFTTEFFEYLIVDEIQDLVNSRAAMVLKILTVMQCGYLLLGDSCQAIYDFDAITTNKMNSLEFYQNLTKLLPETTQYYELVNNHRQTTELIEFAADMREVLLTKSPTVQNTYVNAAIKGIRVFEVSVEQLEAKHFNPNERTAILCRNNGDVLAVSGLLCQAKIAHTINRGSAVKPKYQRFIADVFWDFTEKHMDITEFCERYLARVKKDMQEAKYYFQEFCQLSNAENKHTLNMEDLRHSLLNEPVATSITIAEESNLVISTIHRAKGHEFDTVYMLYSPLKSDEPTAEESRVRYVAITRPKTTLHRLNKKNTWTFRMHKSQNRSYRIHYYGAFFKSRYWCSAIAICNDEHIDRVSFVSRTIHDNSLQIQQYICKQVHPFDTVEAVYCEQKRLYNIMHNNNKIGTLSKNSVSEFWEIICSTNNKNNIPNKLTELFVHNIYSVVNQGHKDNLPTIHQQSGIWLGVDIVGMGRARYSDYS